MTEMIHSILAWVKANREWLKQKLREVVEALVKILSNLWDVLQVIVTVMGVAVKAVGGFKNAMKLLVAVVSVFIGLQLAAGISGLIGVIGNAITIIKSATVAMWGFEASAAGVTGIVYAAIAAIGILFLIGQDLYYYFTGKGKSLFGVLMSDTTGLPAGMKAMVMIARQALGPFGLILNVIDGFRWLAKWYDENQKKIEAAVATYDERTGGADFGSSNGTAHAMIPSLATLVSAGGGSKNITVNTKVDVHGATVNEVTGQITAQAVNEKLLRATSRELTPLEAGPHAGPVTKVDQ